MRVKYISGPHAGEARHVDRSPIIDLLIEAGVLEHAPQLVDAPSPAAPVRTTKWSVGKSVFNKPAISLITRLGETVPFDGPADRAAAAYKSIGQECPAEIIAQYAAVLASQSPAAIEAAQEIEAQRRMRMEDAQRKNAAAETAEVIRLTGRAQ
jgi:hypothetical protein